MVSRVRTARAGILPDGMSDHLRPLLRNAVDVLPEGALERRLAEAEAAGRPLRVKLGVDPTRPDIGPLWHPVRNYVLSCGLRNLAAVYVGGRLVSEHGRSTNPLAAEARVKVREVLLPLARANGWPA